MGEVPAMGLVRLEVPDESYVAARAIIERWERTEVKTAPTAPARRAPGLRYLLLGLVIGAGAIYAAYRAPATTDGIDHNHDGQLDEKWTYSPNGVLVKAEMDRNLDHKVDYVAHHGRGGAIESAEADDNFDGLFETHMGFRNGSLQVTEADTDGDGFLDLRTTNVHGVASTVEYLNAATSRPLRVEHYSLGVMQFADVDTDKDGTLDRRVRYSKLAEVVSTEPLLR